MKASVAMTKASWCYRILLTVGIGRLPLRYNLSAIPSFGRGVMKLWTDNKLCKIELDKIHLINHCFHFIVVLQKTLSDFNETLFVEYGYCNHGDTGCSIINLQPIDYRRTNIMWGDQKMNSLVPVFSKLVFQK